MKSSTQNKKSTFANATYRTYNDLRSQANFQQITPVRTDQSIPKNINSTSRVQQVANKITEIIEICRPDGNPGNDDLTSIIEAEQGILNSLINMENQYQDPKKKSKVQFNQRPDIQQIRTETKLINPQTQANISGIQTHSRVTKGTQKKFISQQDALTMIEEIQGKALRQIQILKRYNNMLISQIDQLAADYQLEHHRRLWLQAELQKLLDFLRHNSMVINFKFPEWYLQGQSSANEPKTIIQNLGLKTNDVQFPSGNVVQTSEFQPVSTQPQQAKTTMNYQQTNQTLQKQQVLQTQEFTNFPNLSTKPQANLTTPNVYQTNMVNTSQQLNQQENITNKNIRNTELQQPRSPRQQYREINIPKQQANYTLQTFNPQSIQNNTNRQNLQFINQRNAYEQTNVRNLSPNNSATPRPNEYNSANNSIYRNYEANYHKGIENENISHVPSHFLASGQNLNSNKQNLSALSNQRQNIIHQVKGDIEDLKQVNNYINQNISFGNIDELQKILEFTQQKANAYKAQLEALQSQQHRKNQYPGLLELLEQEENLRKQTISMLRVAEQHSGRGETFGIPSKKRTYNPGESNYGGRSYNYF